MTQAVEQVRSVELHRGIWIEVPAAPWTSRDRAAWAWPAPIGAAEWAEKYRWLSKSAIPGPWRNRNAPYLTGIMHVATLPGVVEVAIQKAVQLGVSEAARVLIGYWAQQDPEPMGLLLPNEKKGQEIIKNDVIPMFRDEFGRHDELRQLLSPRLHDMKNALIKLVNTFVLYLMWSGSAASMASNPMKRVIADETNKFGAWAGNDADPISLVRKRMRTYAQRLLMLISSPTGPDGQITQAFNGSQVQLYFLVACPHCGCRQRLIFGEGGRHGVKFSDECRRLRKEGRHEAAGAAAMVPGAVWYQCANDKCQGKIDERQKREMVRAGKWGTVGSDLLRGDAGENEKEREKENGVWTGGPIYDVEQLKSFPPETKVGMQIGSQNCVWESWTMAHMAKEFLEANTLEKIFAFRTSTLGEAFEQAQQKVDIDILDKRTELSLLPEGVVPRWTSRLIATIDTQQDHFWLVIRAWGPGLMSARVWNGRVESFGELEQWCWKTPWKNEDTRLPARICDKVLIDSGGTRDWAAEKYAEAQLPSRVMHVYAWALEHSAMVSAIKGDARPDAGRYYRLTQGEYVYQGQKRPVPLWLLDVHHFQDQLADLMGKEVEVFDVKSGEVTGKIPMWQLNKRNDGEYNRHLSAMHKVTERTGGVMVQRWRPKREGMRVDYRACEGYQVAGAFMQGVHLLPSLADYMAGIEAEIVRRNTPAREEPKGFTTPDGRAFVASQR